MVPPRLERLVAQNLRWWCGDGNYLKTAKRNPTRGLIGAFLALFPPRELEHQRLESPSKTIRETPNKYVHKPACVKELFPAAKSFAKSMRLRGLEQLNVLHSETGHKAPYARCHETETEIETICATICDHTAVLVLVCVTKHKARQSNNNV